MHREPLLELIQRYGSRHPDEAEVVKQFESFVRAEPDCFERSLEVGHITGSAWIADATGERVLLTHHRKLDIWIQLGGHADGDPNVLDVALKEGIEESGLDDLEAVSPEIFDLDVHRIPARQAEPEHWHYDVRFAFRHPGAGDYQVTGESHDLAWVPLEELQRYTSEPDMERMAQKWRSSILKKDC